ncbi:MAG: hypothetical protein QNK37_12805 [Acidobacteriota bacterium]|nr:hypothetical protein [Acidobacteriota bacterium]
MNHGILNAVTACKGLFRRPLQRYIEQHIVTALSRYLVEHPELSGGGLHLKLHKTGKVIVKRRM